MLQAGRLHTGLIPNEANEFFLNLPNPSSCTMLQGLTQHLTEMGTRNLPGGDKMRQVRTADNLTTTCEPIV
jgi:hypothetical protein